MIETRNFYIDGAWVAPRDGTDFPVYNPATEETFATISLGGAADAEAAISAARGAFSAWSMTTPAERGEVLRAILAVYEKRAQDMAEAISTEMGAPIDMALTDQAGAGRSHLKAFIRALDAFQWEHPLRPGVEGQEMSYEPAGVAALITPWNWPMNQVVLKVGAALAAGCTMVLKPSEVAPMSSILFSEIIHEAGVPAG
ncbi:MAG: aldehyde dehydrogenase family protein, partial [Pseudomonadota bacterium]|nr:aldehyde dehydrogenase family protein [Pseudomonadota bacterium]